MWLGEAAPLPSEGLDSLLPPWAQQLSLISVLTVVIFAFLKGWVLPRWQAEREIEAERRIAGIWQENANQATELNRELTAALAPVLEQNEAILKAVEALQRRAEAQEDEARRLRERRGTGR